SRDWSSDVCSSDLWAKSNNVRLPRIPDFATNNAHMFYMIFNSIEHRASVIKKLKDNNIHAVFHYLSLHKSPFYHDKHDGRELLISDHYSDCLLRLPMYFELEDDNVNKIIEIIKSV